MKTLAKFLCVTALAALLGSAVTAIAQTDSTNAAPAAPAKPKSKTTTAVVDKVDNDAKTIALKGHDKPFGITSKTKISKDGQPALLSDIVAGDKVTIRAKDDASGNPVATSIRVGKAKAKTDAPAAAPATPAAPGDSK